MKPEMFCRNSNGTAPLARQLDEVRALQRALRKQDAVIGQDRTGMPQMRAKPHTRVVP
jgi:hypothetical protein